MREIKFRAWDKSNQCMVYPGEENTVFTFTNGILCVECLETVWKEGGGETYEKDEFFQVDCEIMQFTGLKDKNGKEIYEGDFVQGGGCLKPHDVRWNDAGRWSFGESLLDFTQSTMLLLEVIGNIYENPELRK